MPLLHTSLHVGILGAYRQSISDGFGRAMHETFNLPEDNQFMAKTGHDATNSCANTSYVARRPVPVSAHKVDFLVNDTSDRADGHWGITQRFYRVGPTASCGASSLFARSASRPGP